MFAVVVIILCSGQLMTTSAQCPHEEQVGSECVQKCQSLEGCDCSTQNITDSCSQTCDPPGCFGGEMTCKAEKNCTQICRPGGCEMKCDAQQYCMQDAYNHVKNIICSSEQCIQNCHQGNCKNMYCDEGNCYQTCGKGGCVMNCTESVKFCSQTCTANDNCVLVCYAEECEQRCSGPKSCVIINKHNAGFGAVPIKFLAYFTVIAAVMFQSWW